MNLLCGASNRCIDRLSKVKPDLQTDLLEVHPGG
jgi:hypothetical protein